MRIIFASLIFISSLSLQAHPVIYKDGWVYDGFFMPNMNIQRVSYTLESNFALESNTTYLKNFQNYRDYAFGFNYLFKRWFLKKSQGNIYGMVHGGYYAHDFDEGIVGHATLMGDWESREVYTAAKAKLIYLDNENELWKYSYRIGLAPYVAGMDTLQTWIVLQFDYFKANSRNILVTPLLRFFYKNVLWEIGANTRSQYYLNLMVHI